MNRKTKKAKNQVNSVITAALTLKEKWCSKSDRPFRCFASHNTDVV